MESYLIPEPPLLILPTLAKVIGLNEAIMLQQCHYWLQRTTHARGEQRWFYKSTKDWGEEFPFFSESTIKRTLNSLRDKGLIETEKVKRKDWDHTNWLTINYLKLKELMSDQPLRTVRLVQIEPIDQSKMTRSTGSKRPNRSGQPAPIYRGAKTSSENTSKIEDESAKAEEFVGRLPAEQLAAYRADVVKDLPIEERNLLKNVTGKHGRVAMLIYTRYGRTQLQ